MQKHSCRCKDTDNKVTTDKNQDGIPTLAVFFTSCWAGDLEVAAQALKPYNLHFVSFGCHY